MRTVELGRRVDLLSMDPHFFEISIAIYRSDDSTFATYVLNSYSQRKGTADRLVFLADTMRSLGDMLMTEENPLSLRFSCGHAHQLALKRLFVEACKIMPGSDFNLQPLWVLDKKNDLTIHADSLGKGRYLCRGDRDGTREERRVAAMAAGLGKLAELDVDGNEISFPCGFDHHKIVALLLTRALNVRNALREQEASATRGVLNAPSQQR